MNLEKYMTFDSVWEALKSEDTDTMMAEYEKPVTIKTFQYGKDIFLRDKTDAATVSARVYLTTANVKPKDKIDGQVVQSVNNYPESWDSKNMLYECLTWNR